MTDKQARFCEEYLIDLNATQAAIRAGYNEKTAYSMGQRLLKNVEVQREIQKAMGNRSKRTEVTQDWVLSELLKIAAADRGGIAQVVTKEWTEDIVDEETGETRQVSHVAQCVQVKNTGDLDESQRAALAGVEETKYGIKVSTYDKVKALELLGKHLGMFTDKMQLSGQLDVKSDKLDAILEQLNE